MALSLALAVVAAALISAAMWPATGNGAFPGQNGKIFFHSQQSPNGDLEIYSMNPDGSGQTNITNEPGFADAYPAASPDGQKVAFARLRDGNEGWEIYVIDADGSNLTRLTNQDGCDLTPSWSPDGQKIAFESHRSGSGQIFVMNADGTDQTAIPGTSAGCGSTAGNPAWSPDGQRIAFEGIHTGNPEIFVVNADGTGLTNLTNNPANDGDPSWSPDGLKLAFHSDRATAPSTFEIFRMNADGTDQTRVTTTVQNDSQPSWSPDGQKIAFDTLAGTSNSGRRDIAVVDVNGTNRTVLTANTVQDGTPDWSFGGPLTPPPTVTALSPTHAWVGLKNGDDQGTQFDLMAELLKNGTPVASGLKRCITGVTRNANLATEAVVPWDAFASVPTSSGDVLSLRLSTRIGTNPNGSKCSGPGGSHSSAVGLRLYYDSVSRPSHFDATIAPNPNQNLYLHSDGNPCGNTESTGVTTRSLDSTPPSGTNAKCKDSGAVKFAGGNALQAIGTWSLAAMP